MTDAEKFLTDTFVERHPDDAARLVERRPVDEAIGLFQDLTTAQCAGIIAHMAPAAGSSCLANLPGDGCSALVNELPVDIAARLLRPLNHDTRERLLVGLPLERRRAILALATATAGTIGSVTNSHVFALPIDATVGQAQEQLRASTVPYVYIIDRAHHLRGVVGASEVWAVAPEQGISTLMNPNVIYLYADADITAMIPHHAWHDYETLPVVDRDRVYVGAVSHKTLRRVVGTDRTVVASESMMTTLIGLGELYWTGMVTVIMSLSRDALLSAPDVQRRRGDNNDA